MKILCKILLLVGLVLFTGCRSHRVTVRQESARYQRAILDSAAATADTVRRVDSAAVRWLEEAVLLEWDSVDYRIVLDSAGRTVGVSGKRLLSRRSGSATTATAQRHMEQSHGVAHGTTVVSDSVRHALTEERHVETRAEVANPLGWLKWAGVAVLLALSAAGVIHLRKVTERWSRR